MSANQAAKQLISLAQANRNKILQNLDIFADFCKELPQLRIDQDGIFNYLQIKLFLKADTDHNVLLIRGDKESATHTDVHNRFKEEWKQFTNKHTFQQRRITSSLVGSSVLGGGMIKHDIQHQCITVFGFSMKYGLAKHEDTKDIINKHIDLQNWSANFSYAKWFQCDKNKIIECTKTLKTKLFPQIEPLKAKNRFKIEKQQDDYNSWIRLF